MPRPKRLSGPDIVRIFEHFSFKIESQRGSHIKIVRVKNGEKQVLLISNHKELKMGAVVGIFKQAVRYIPESDLREYFYTD